jgi:hypothetical protein
LVILTSLIKFANYTKMASFTDNINALTTFKPYVAQQPVEAMVQVGVQKQAQYDQGIQKIQSQIDQVAGMDVVRDVDKQYLQSKLDKLGGDLRKVAAGDFSNYQLVNSVGGMVTNIAKDKNVQNAVSSTARYRKGIADMDAAIKEGKSAPSNEWDFQNQAFKWMNGDVSSSFTGGYNPYTNYKKNAIEVLKALTKSKSIRDDAFTMDSKGNITGIADATLRKEMAGIPPEQIQTALMATLSPADFKQMEIDGRYSYSNASPEQLSKTVTASSNAKIGFYEQQKKVLLDAKDGTTSNVEKTKLEEQIAELDKTINGISRENQAMLDNISKGDTEGIKAQLHTANFLDNFSRAFSFTETSQTYVGKTPREREDWKFEQERDWLKFTTNLGWDKEKFALSYAQKNKEIFLKEQEVNGSYGALGKGVDQKTVPEYTIERFIGETTSSIDNLKLSDAEFMGDKGQQWFDSQKKAWEERPSGVDPIVKDYFQSTAETRRKIESNLIAASEIQKQAEAQFGTIEQYIPEDAENVEYFDEASGQYITYTPEEIVKFNSISDRFKKYSTTSPSANRLGTDLKITLDFEKAKQELSPKEYKLFEAFSKNKTSQDRMLVSTMQEYARKVNTPFKEKLKEVNKFTTDEITKRITGQQGRSYALPTANELQKSQVGSVLTDFADLAESLKGKLAGDDKLDVATLRKLAVDPALSVSLNLSEKTDYSDPLYTVSVTGKDGVNMQFNITPEQKNDVFGNRFEPAPEVAAFRPYQNQIRLMGGKSTALTKGESNHNNAFLNKNDFRNVVDYGVKANIVQPSPGKYSIRLSLYDPIAGKWFDNLAYPKEALLREDQVVPFMESLNDSDIYKILNEKVPSPGDLARVKNASKKPL